MAQNYTFEGWLGKDQNAVGNMVWESFMPKPFEETDVDIQVTHTSICGTDLHTLRAGWSNHPGHYPVCVGHEVVGRVVRVGSTVNKALKVGDRVGVGAQCNSCLACHACRNGEENYCEHFQDAYTSRYPDGSKAFGGYASHVRVPGHFAFAIPPELPSAAAAPMLCAGITMYAPLVDNGAGPGKTVGIIGFGGLGHFGLLFAKALGADRVVVISRTSSKKEDAIAQGADEYIATAEESQDWDVTHRRSLDLILSTVDSPHMPLAKYLRLLKVHGTFVQLGAPEGDLPPINVFELLNTGTKITSARTGSPAQIRDMFALAVRAGVKPWFEERPMQQANQAVLDMQAGKARYRYVLVQ